MYTFPPARCSHQSTSCPKPLWSAARLLASLFEIIVAARRARARNNNNVPRLFPGIGRRAIITKALAGKPASELAGAQLHQAKSNHQPVSAAGPWRRQRLCNCGRQFKVNARLWAAAAAELQANAAQRRQKRQTDFGALVCLSIWLIGAPADYSLAQLAEAMIRRTCKHLFCEPIFASRRFSGPERAQRGKSVGPQRPGRSRVSQKDKRPGGRVIAARLGPKRD